MQQNILKLVKRYERTNKSEADGTKRGRIIIVWRMKDDERGAEGKRGSMEYDFLMGRGRGGR